VLEEFRTAMRDAAQVMRSTADRFDALVAREDLTLHELQAALEEDVAQLDAAMATLVREMGGE
jgi:hypothetical protein